MMKQHIWVRGGLSLVCGLILAACGSSGGGSDVSAVSRNFSVSSNSGASSSAGANQSAALAAAQKSAAEAKAELAKANEQLAAAQKAAEAASKGSAAEIAAAKQATANAEAAKKTAETALAKAQSELKTLQENQTKAVAEAEKLGYEKAKKEQEEAIEKAKQEAEKAKQEKVKAAVQAAFIGEKDDVLAGKQFNYQNLNTTVLRIDGDGESKVEVNQQEQPAVNAITINGTRIALLSRQVAANSQAKINLVPLEAADFADGKLPEGAKGGFVGSWTGLSWGAFGKMRFGVYTDEKNTAHLFVNGELPSARVLNGTHEDGLVYDYKGSAIIGKDGAYTPLPDSVSGTVNFATKKVDLTLQADADTAYKFGGDIKGNTFGGESADGVSTRGGFYGYMDTLGGVLHINQGKYAGYNGVYGAGQEGRGRKE